MVHLSHICKEPLAWKGSWYLSNLNCLLCYKDNTFVFLSTYNWFSATWQLQEMRKAIFCVMESTVAVISHECRCCLFRFLLCVWIASCWGILFSPAANGSPWHPLPGICFTEFLLFQQENAILTMELRNYFSLYCLHQETQLIHIYLPLTSHILGAFVNSQIQGHKEVNSLTYALFPKTRMKILNLFSPVGLPPLIINPDGIFHDFLISHLRYFQ